MSKSVYINKVVLRRIIARIVYENTQPTPTKESARTLNKYLSNPNTVDLVYEKLIDRCKSSLNVHSQVLGYTVKLLKTHLTQHIPSMDTLHKLDTFCKNIHTNKPQIARSVLFIRKLILSLIHISEPTRPY
eukprot:TRINITY_DN3619_c0_g1_i1.p1 TRINITY_DN3619_c0_g1~~TRINITY_DN3619_c0_g1_i1.p1  ORF type:complete len:131 (-),score=0.31 TRINITY_DN3619_c0_g1_i1:4-396(-)